MMILVYNLIVEFNKISKWISFLGAGHYKDILRLKLFNSVFSQLGYNESKDIKTYETQKNSLIANLNNINKEINNLTSFIAKGSANDFKSVTLKLEELENQKEMIKEERRKVEHEISLIKNTVVDKSDLKQIFKDLSKYYDAASKEERKYMIKTIIREITIKLKKKEEKGTIAIHFRGDGHIKKEWVNRIVNPDKIVSSYYLDWLRKLKSLRTFFSNNKELYTYQYCIKVLAER